MKSSGSKRPACDQSCSLFAFDGDELPDFLDQWIPGFGDDGDLTVDPFECDLGRNAQESTRYTETQPCPQEHILFAETYPPRQISSSICNSME